MVSCEAAAKGGEPGEEKVIGNESRTTYLSWFSYLFHDDEPGGGKEMGGVSVLQMLCTGI